MDVADGANIHRQNFVVQMRDTASASIGDCGSELLKGLAESERMYTDRLCHQLHKIIRCKCWLFETQKGVDEDVCEQPFPSRFCCMQPNPAGASKISWKAGQNLANEPAGIQVVLCRQVNGHFSVWLYVEGVFLPFCWTISEFQRVVRRKEEYLDAQ